MEIELSINLIYLILDQPVCTQVRDKLYEYILFLEWAQVKMPSKKALSSAMLSRVGKAIHVENYTSSSEFFFILSVFFEKMHAYISSYNAVKRKRKVDKEIYTDFCERIFIGSTPCFELTYETISAYAPSEGTDYEETDALDFAVVSKEKIFVEYNERLKRELSSMPFFFGLLDCYRKFICFLYDVVCDDPSIKFEKMYNPTAMFEFLNYFGYIDEYEELEDIIDAQDLEDALAREDLGFKAGVDYILKKACC